MLTQHLIGYLAGYWFKIACLTQGIYMNLVRYWAKIIIISMLLSGCITAGGEPSNTQSQPSITNQGSNNNNAQQPKPPIRDIASERREAKIALEREIHELWRKFPGKTGIAVRRIDGDWTIGRRLNDLFPQQSVSKIWVAMTILDKVDRRQLSLADPVKITKNDLAVFHQPIRSQVIREGVVTESIRSLMERAIIKSDNTANDSLLRTVGGPNAVRRFLSSRRLGRIRFGPGERLLQSSIAGVEWRQEYSEGRKFFTARANLPREQRKRALDRYLADPVDGATPDALVNALDRLSKNDLLSTASSRLLLNLMTRVTSGPRRLKAGVPAGWQFLHKTGTGQDLPPVSTGYNDIGIMTAPDGTRYAVAVLLADTTASVPERMQLMQSVTRAVARYHR